MKIIGITVAFAFGKSTFLDKYASLLSIKINRLSEDAKRQLVIAFILLSVAMCSWIFFQGISKENTAALRIPVWEPPIIYYDSLFLEPLNK
jgi:hypothetical protein